MADTWNAIGTTFQAIKMNISDGAGGAPVGATASRAFLLQANSVDIFGIDISGSLFWGASGGDLALVRDAANTIAQRNGTAAQTFNLYNTYTDASNFENVILRYAGNQAQLITNAAGTGIVRQLALGVQGAQLVFTNGSNAQLTSNLLFSADNTYDIGPSGLRPRHYIGAGFVKTAYMTLASLSASISTAAAAGAGARACISDGLAPVFTVTAAGGGTVPVGVYSDGTQWRAG